MPISLNSVRNKLLLRTQKLDDAFFRFIATDNITRRIDRSAFQEGLISAMWQAWCLFCREVFLESAQGAITSSGTVVACPYSGRPELEVLFIASKLSKNENIGVIRPILGHHLEPTWGNVTTLNRISSGLGVSNQAALLSAFGVIATLSDLQMCRNACAHVGPSTISDIKLAKVRYLDNLFAHPSDMIHWVDPATNDFLWQSWSAEMKIVSMQAII